MKGFIPSIPKSNKKRGKPTNIKIGKLADLVSTASTVEKARKSFKSKLRRDVWKVVKEEESGVTSG